MIELVLLCVCVCVFFFFFFFFFLSFLYRLIFLLCKRLKLLDYYMNIFEITTIKS
ncbi:hypothetical protein Hanom_Chr12g01102731 [Helianthus anomalus]